jgi:hypothetical protein
VTGELLVFARAVLFLTFVSSAIGKARDIGAFAESIRSFRLLPDRWSRPTAWAALAAEVAAALLQLPGAGAAPLDLPGARAAVPGLALALAMLVTYTAALSIALARQAELRCNCFGSASRPVSGVDLVRNVLLAGVAVAGLVAASERPRGLSASGDALVILPAAAAVLILVSLHDVVTILRTPVKAD